MQKEENKFASETAGNSLPILWKRCDEVGLETCRLLTTEMGWRLTGAAVFVADGQACQLNYGIACDRHWVTQSAEVMGWVGNRTIDVRIVRDEEDQWSLNEQVCGNVAGCLDIDLNFSPSTNLLPIRRLNLAIGESESVRAAWLRFPSFTLEPLDQTYTRLQERQYRYESGGGQFTADLMVDESSLVIDYGELWKREVQK